MLNKVIIIGRLGKEPDVKTLASGSLVANFSVATTEKWKDKSGEQNEKTEWHKCSAFGKTAEICERYLKKGSLVYVEGRLQTRSWEDDSGETKYITEIKVDKLLMLGAKEKTEDRNEPPPFDYVKDFE